MAIDDYAQDTGTTGRLTAGGNATGSFDSFFDDDWFRIALNAGTTYVFRMSGVNTSDPDAQFYLSVKSGTGAFIPYVNARIGGSYGAELLTFTPTSSGNYFLSVMGSSGTYGISAQIGPTDDAGVGIGTSAVLAPGQTVSATFGTVNDSDWFKMPLQAGILYQATVRTSDPSLLDTLYASTFNSRGIEVASWDVNNQAGTIVTSFNPTQSGDYFLELRSRLGSGNYSVQLGPAADDAGSNAATALAIDVGSSFDGVVNLAGDRDWLAVDLVAGTSYTVWDEAAGTAPLYLSVIDPVTGVPESQAARSHYVPQYTGRHYLEVVGYQVQDYRVGISLLIDDFRSDAATTGRLMAGSTSVGQIDYAGDRDWFRLPVVAGHSYSVIPSADSGQSPGASLVTGAGVAGTLHRPFNGQSGGHLYFKATETGDAMIQLAGGFNYASYRVVVTGLSGDDYGDTTSAAALLAPGVTVSGRIESNIDADVFMLPLEQGVSYRIAPGGELWSGISGSNHLLLSNLSPNHYPNSIEALKFTPSGAGQYYLKVSSDGAVGNYTVLASAVAGDTAASPAGAQVLAMDATVTQDLHALDDRDWFAVNLEAGKAYAFDVRFGANMVNFDARFKLLDAAGAQLAVVDKGVANVYTISYTATASGTFFLETSNTRGYMFGPQNPYTVGAKAVPPDDFPVPAMPALGTTVSGAIETSIDTDVFRFELKAGTYYRIESSFTDRDGKPLPAFIPALTGGAVGRTTNLLGESYYKPTVDAVFEMKLDAVQKNIGSYTFRVSHAGQDDQIELNREQRPLPVGEPTPGVLEVAGDVDRFSLVLAAGQRVVMTLSGADTGGGTLDLAKAPLYLSFERNGQPLYAFPATGATQHQLFKAVTAGTYTVNVNGEKLVGSYTLTVTDTTADIVAPQVQAGQAISTNGVGFRAPVSLAFSETVIKSAGNVTIYDAGGRTIVVESVKAATVQVNGDTLSITPKAFLVPGNTYTIGLDGSTLRDLAGNVLAATPKTSFTVHAGSASSGNDVLGGRLNGAMIDAGTGNDSVVYEGHYSEYKVVRVNAGFTISNASGSSAGADTLVGVERILFSYGQAILLETDGAPSAAYRVYRAAFDRTPDLTGLGFWMAAMENGVSLLDVAQGFVSSAEFGVKYAAASTNAQFVARLYENVLDRPGEQSGIDFWTRALDLGASRASVLAGFSDSGENIAAVALLIGNGIPYVPYGG